jgi:gas vesicle protein
LGRANESAEKAVAARRRGGFVFGMVTGIAAGLLLAPKSGRETREQLLGEGGLNKQVERLRSAVGAGRESAAGQSESLRRKIEETRERLRQYAGEAGEAGPAGPAGGQPAEHEPASTFTPGGAPPE